MCIIGLLNIFSSCDIISEIQYYNKIYEITDIGEYGNFSPTRYGDSVEEYTKKVMPEKIEDFFSVKKYSYKMCHSPYMHEAYLEVTIEDEETYQNYIQEIIGDKPAETFFYDESFQEYVVEDRIRVHPYDNDWESIVNASIQKICFSDEANVIIFVSLAVPSEYFLVTDFVYFERFNINATNYYDGKRLISF